MTFQGKKVLVVGGSSGIGASIVDKLVSSGCEVINASRRSNPKASVNIALDVLSDFTQLDGIPDQLDGVVYCPGSINLKPFQSLSIDHFQEDLEVNVLGAVKVLKATWKALRKSGNAGVVLFSTVAVSQGMNFHASVATSKGAIEGLMRSLAAEWSRSNIRVNAIAPSLTDTPMASNLLSSEEKRNASSERHPLKRVGTAEELAETAIFLLSDHASWMTGQTIHIDGGMSSVRSL
jgi:NAD(P)-dependent dehydrogenase (short-subunit alcohol dehydrogenase family)